MSELDKIPVYLCHAKIKDSGQTFGFIVTGDLEHALAYTKDRKSSSDLTCELKTFYINKSQQDEVVISRKMFDDMCSAIRRAESESSGCYCHTRYELRAVIDDYNDFAIE